VITRTYEKFPEGDFWTGITSASSHWTKLAYERCDDIIRTKSSILFGADNASKWRKERIVVTRREFVRTFAMASAGALVRAVPESAPRSQDFGPVRQHILQAIANGDATGVAVAVARGGSIIWEEGFGWANRESGLQAAANTPFSLASITKPFTTTTLMILAAEGKLDLDDPASKYLRQSNVQGPNGNPNEATLRRLGAHVGGLPSMFEWCFPNRTQCLPTAEDLLRDYGRLAYPPGSCYEYSNIGTRPRASREA
jgi:CubicO group peptidase (beta-lactamase class C family)